MNVNVATRSTAIDKYKNEIIQFMIINPETALKQGTRDSVLITDIGKLLYDLSKAGYSDSREIISNVLAGRQDDNLENFLTAYCYIYGYDFTKGTVSYDRYGNSSYSDYFTALKKYLNSFGDYLLEEPEENDVPGSFLKSLREYLKRFKNYLKS
jgi:hypothetical protein